MNQLFDFFNPVNINVLVSDNYNEKSRLINKIVVNSINKPLTELGKTKVAIFGVSKEVKGSINSSDLVRHFLYSLFTPYNINIIDLGNLKSGKKTNDIIYGIREVISYLHSKKITSIIIGDNNNLPFGNYLAYEETKKPINIVSIDSTIFLKQKNIDEQDIHYIPKIVLRNNNCL